MIQRSPFRYFKTSPEIVRLAVMKHIRFPLFAAQPRGHGSHQRSIAICHETVRFWWHWFGPPFAAEIRKRRIEEIATDRLRSYGAALAPTAYDADLQPGQQEVQRGSEGKGLPRKGFSGKAAQRIQYTNPGTVGEDSIAVNRLGVVDPQTRRVITGFAIDQKRAYQHDANIAGLGQAAAWKG